MGSVGTAFHSTTQSHRCRQLQSQPPAIFRIHALTPSNIHVAEVKTNTTTDQSSAVQCLFLPTNPSNTHTVETRHLMEDGCCAQAESGQKSRSCLLPYHITEWVGEEAF